MIITNKGMVLNNGVLYFENTPKLVGGVLDISSSPTTNAAAAVLTKVELYDNDRLLDTCTCHDRLMSMTIERAGQNGKFFGFGVFHKLTIELLDLEENLHLAKGNIFKAYAGYDEDNMIKPYPTFYVYDFVRDENNGIITVTCYDALYAATETLMEDVNMLFAHFEEVPDEEGNATLQEVISYSIRSFLEGSVFEYLKINNIEIVGLDASETCFNTFYPNGANFNGNESFKYALDSIAEVTQTVYYVNNEDNLVFKRPNVNGTAVLTIDEGTKISLASGDPITLVSIANVTELGDNVAITPEVEGVTQYVRDNPFWEMREDIVDLVTDATAAVIGLTMTPFLCDWLGNFLLEIGDKVDIVATENKTISVYLFNDIIRFNGALIESTQWTYEAQEETHTNPTTLGEVINQTIAKVDKINKKITLLVANTEKNTQKISKLQITDSGILASVSELDKKAKENKDSIDGVKDEVALLKIKKDKIVQEVTEEITENGVSKVKTTVGAFTNDGFTIAKTDSETSTNINQDGMTIYVGGIVDEDGNIIKENDEIPNEKLLIANSAGVKAKDLHATTFLLIGNNTYFRDFVAEDGEDRAGCFWTGK